jgi:hypothetical protein
MNNISNVINSISNLRKIFQKIIRKTKKRKYIKTKKNININARKSPISLNDLIYYLCIKNGKKQSFANAKSEYNKLKNTKLSKSAFVQQKSKVTSDTFNIINSELIKDVYKNNLFFTNGQLPHPQYANRIIAADGSQINFYKKNSLDLPLSDNKLYKIGILSTLYDISNNLPINYLLTGETDERTLLKKQLESLQPFDVLVADRGYFSYDLVNILNSKNIHYIFRIKNSYKIIKETFRDLPNNKNYDVILNTIYNNVPYKIRIIKFYIDDKEYYIATSLLNNIYSTEWFKNIYHKRWQIEEHFKTLKNTVEVSPRSTTLNGIQQDLYINQFILIINNYICSLLNNFIDSKKHKINQINSIKMIIDHILPHLFYNKTSVKKIMKTLIEIKNNVTQIVNNRHFIRVCILPHSKWYCSGNKEKKMNVT